MTREPKNKPEAKPTQKRFNDVIFVNWSLSVEEKAECKNWLLGEGELDNACLLLIEAGYKTTISWDNYRECFTASIVPAKDAKINQGYILTGKGSTPLKAIKQAAYIHFHIMDGDWSSYSTAKSAEELDD